MITNQDRNAIRRIFEKTRDDIEPLVARKAKALGIDDPRMLNVMTAQNALRCCMEVVFEKCIPYDRFFCTKMAVRLAAYAISARRSSRTPTSSPPSSRRCRRLGHQAPRRRGDLSDLDHR